MLDRKLMILCFIAAGVCLYGAGYAAAARILRYPYWIPVALSFAAGAAAPAVRGFRQVRMFRALSAKSAFSVAASPARKDRLYFGRGFRWTNKHVWRMKDLTTNGDAAKFWPKTGEEGGSSLMQGVGATEESELFLPVSDMAGHAAVVGTTRVGKTRLAELLLVQLLGRNEPVIVIDPKGEPELLNSVYSKLAQRGEQDRLQFFAPAYPEQSATYNPLGSFEQLTDIADRITAVLPGGPDAQPFKDFCFNVVLQTARGLSVAGHPINLETLGRYSLSNEFTGELLVDVVRKYLESTGQPDKKGSPEEMGELYVDLARKTGVADEACEGIKNLYAHPGQNFGKMSNALGPFFSRLTEGTKRRILCSEEPDISWQSAVSKRKVVYFYMGSLVGPTTANGICKMALQDLSSFIGTRYIRSTERFPIWLFVDEFQDVDYDGFVGLLAKSGGAGLRIILAMQSIADLKVKTSLGEAHARQILANTGTKVFLRTGDAETAKEFTDKAGKTSVPEITEMIAVTPEVDDAQEMFDANHRRNKRYVEEQLVREDWITGLPKGQAFISTQGNRLFKARFPLLAPAARDYFADKGLRTG